MMLVRDRYSYLIHTVSQGSQMQSPMPCQSEPSCRVLTQRLSNECCYQAADIEVYCFGDPLFGPERLPWNASQWADYCRQHQQLPLAGHFALVVHRPQSLQTDIYADRFSSQRLYYSQQGKQLLISDQLQLIKEQLADKPGLNQQSLVNYLFFHMIPSPETIYQGVFCLEPGQQVRIVAENKTLTRWWQPQFNSDQGHAPQALAEQLLGLMRTIIPDYVDSDCGCFLSGGLDSSSIAGLVAEQRPNPDVFSIGFPLEQYNELEYAHAAVQHFQLNGHEQILIPEDVVLGLPKVVASMDQPFGNSSAIPAYFCAEMAKQQGVSRLIAGDGGDELFAGNERYAKQLRLEKLRQRLKPVLGLMDLGLLALPWPDRGLIGKARSLTRQLKMTIPENLEYFNFFNLIGREHIWSDQIQKGFDLWGPDKRCQQLFDQPDSATVLDRMLYLDWKHTLADNDLIKVNEMCRLAGVQVCYPMLDDRLVDFSLQVPTKLKLMSGQLRYLYKRAMAGFLPEQIINKPKHGFGLPFGLWTAEHSGLREVAYQAIASLDQYELFQSGFIDEVKRLHQREHAKHYGELVWVLMVMALWLDRFS